MTLFKKLEDVPYDGCPKDYKNHHLWRSIGIDSHSEVFKCSQCNGIVWVLLVPFEEIKDSMKP